MNDISMDADLSESSRNRNWFMRNDPCFSGTFLFHRKSCWRIQRFDALLFKLFHDFMSDMRYVIDNMMKFRICNGSSRRTQGLAVHFADETNKRPSFRKQIQNLFSLVPKFISVNRDEPNIVGSCM